MNENIYNESLLPCPFCGATSKKLDKDGKNNLKIVILRKTKKKVSDYGMNERMETVFAVNCVNCGCSGGIGITGYNALIHHTTTEKEAEEIAIQKWNTRNDSKC